MIVTHLFGLAAKLYLSYGRRCKMDSIVTHFQHWPPQNQTLSLLLACGPHKDSCTGSIVRHTCSQTQDSFIRMHRELWSWWHTGFICSGLMAYQYILLDCLHLPIIIYYCSAYTHMVSLYMISDCLLTHNVVHNFKIGLLAQLEGTLNLTTTRLEV